MTCSEEIQSLKTFDKTTGDGFPAMLHVAKITDENILGPIE